MIRHSYPRGPGATPSSIGAWVKGGVTLQPPAEVNGRKTSALWAGNGLSITVEPLGSSRRFEFASDLEAGSMTKEQLRDAIAWAGADPPRGSEEGDLLALLLNLPVKP